MDKQPGHDERPGESPAERADRNFGDLLQELRVTQTGVQILFAFLLILAFEPRFSDLDRLAVIIYVITVGCCAAAVIFLIAPVALHRAMFALGRKGEVVEVSAKQAKTGVGLLGIAIVGATLLALDSALPRWLALVIVAGIAITLLTVWYVVPARRVRRKAKPDPTQAPGV
ncbi:MAG: amine oxidase [Geodermatophilaceae bacterium]|nr:amine oxidase [Geodermatophilaceae bacterium]